MPVIEPPAAMVKIPMRGFLTLTRPRCKNPVGASTTPRPTERFFGGGSGRRGFTGSAFFALVGVAAAACKIPGQRVGCGTPATAGDIDAR